MRIPFWAQTFIGLGIGVALGFVARGDGNAWLTTTLVTVGSIFITMLMATVAPLVLTALIVSVNRLGQVENAARIAAKTLMWFAITAFIAVLLGIAIGLFTNPGAHTHLSAIAAADATYSGGSGSWLDFLKGVVPGNILGLQGTTHITDGVATTAESFNILQLLVIGIVLGIAALKVGAKAKPFVDFAESVLEIIQKALWWVIRLALIGAAGLIGKAVATYGWDGIKPLGLFVLDVYVGCLIVLFVVYPVLLHLHGLSAARFMSGAWPAIVLGFASRSSMGTMPLTLECTTNNLGVPQEYASFAVPLGATTKMDGCAAIYSAIAAILVAHLFGIQLTFTSYLLIVIVSVIGSAATAGLTGSIVMLTLTLSTLGLPLAGVGLLIAIDPIMDMMRTATNVAGQALVPTLVAKEEGILDLDRFNGVHGVGTTALDTVEPTRVGSLPDGELELVYAGESEKEHVDK
ncbi:MAG: dicarboxylate/amino acid:cation symporter [Nakamurella sp.]